MGLGEKRAKAFFGLLLGITLCILISPPIVQAVQLNFSPADEPVPKSETIIIPGQLNDTKEHALSFDHETEYVFGNAEQTAQSQVKQKQPTKTALLSESKTNRAIEFASPPAWRKTSFDKTGTLVVTISFDAETDYAVEVYNSCSNKNFCTLYDFGRFKTCTMNSQPGEYYFKITNNSGSGKYYLDVDIIEGKQISKTNATDCTSSTTENSCKGSVPLYRFWNTKTGTHFYTTSETEKTKIITTYKEWIYEGIAADIHTTQKTGTTPLYRFWNTKTGTHFYTTSEKEKNKLITTYKEWIYEGITG